METITKVCEKCGGTKYNNKGISKTGNPYENWKCGKCKDTEWVTTQFPASAQNNAPRPYVPRQLPNDPNRLNDKDKAFGQAKGAAFNKSVDVVIAGFNRDIFTYEEIPQKVEEMFQVLVKINAGDDVA